MPNHTIVHTNATNAPHDPSRAIADGGPPLDGGELLGRVVILRATFAVVGCKKRSPS